MPLERFTQMERDKKIYFRRLDGFDDPVEGMQTLPQVQEIQNEFKAAPDIGSILIAFNNVITRNRLYVSSWHESTAENALMWEAYADRRKGVAIRSTVCKVKNSIAANANLQIRRVDYIDFKEPHEIKRSMENQAALKRLEFYAEREIRFIHFNPPSESIMMLPNLLASSPGLSFELNLPLLADEIVFGDLVSNEDFDKAIATLKNSCPNVPVRRTQIYPSHRA